MRNRGAEELRRAPGRASTFKLLTASVSVSAFGTWSYNVGIAVYAYRSTHSANWVAAATVGRYVPALLLTWFASRWIDRFPRRTVAIVADLVCAAAMVAITVVAVARGPLVLAIGLAAVSSGASRVQSSAALSVAADVVAESQLIRTTILISTAEALATAIGPAFAYLVLTTYPPSVLFAINGFTFVASAWLWRGVDAGRPRLSWARPPGNARAETSAYRAVLRAVWPLVATRTTAALVFGFDVVLLAVIATRQLRQGTDGYGLMLAASGVGGLVVALALRRSSGSRAGLISLFGMALYALPLAAFALRPDLAVNLGIQLVRGIGVVLVTSTVVAGLQRAVPSNASGRLFGLLYALVLAGTCTGAVAAAAMFHFLGFTTTVVGAAVLPFAVQLAIVPWLVRFDRDGAEALAPLDPRVDVLRRLVLFRDASRATLYDVAERAIEEPVESGRIIIGEGDVSDALFVLMSGAVDVTRQTPAGPTRLRRMTALDYFGEIGLIHNVPRTATVTAVGQCTVWRIPAPIFLGAAMQAGFSGALADTAQLRVETEQPTDISIGSPA